MTPNPLDYLYTIPLPVDFLANVLQQIGSAEFLMADLGFLHQKNPLHFSAGYLRERSVSGKRDKGKKQHSISYHQHSRKKTYVLKFILNTQWILIKCCSYVVLGFWACNGKSFVQTEFRLKSPSFFPDNI